MNPEVAIDIFKTTIIFALYVVTPFLGVMLIIGLATSLLQTVTSLQEPTLTFAPKLIALAATLILLAPWLLRSMSEFTVSIITRMGTMAH
ncbi:MAG: flagellar biosynthetic protein FliQ [Opitutae bacterium]